MNRFSSEIILHFNQIFIFYAFSVGFCAIRAPTDFGASCTFSNLIIHVGYVYAVYAKLSLLKFTFFVFNVIINLLIVWTALVNKY